MTKLRKLRKQRGKTMTALAIECRVEPSTLCLIEQGKRPSLENARFLARALGVDPTEIWPDFSSFRHATNMRRKDKI